MVMVRKADIKWIILGGIAAVALVVVLIVLLAGNAKTPDPTQPPTTEPPIVTETPTPTPEETPTPTPEPTPTPTPEPTPTPTPEPIVMKATDKLNVRESANKTAKIVVTLNKDEQVTLLDASDSKWYKIRTSAGKEGYCSSDYLVLVSGSTPAPAAIYMKVAVDDSLNLRDKASTSGKVVTGMDAGTIVKLIEAANADGWCKIQLKDGTTGYCKAEFLAESSTGW